MTIGFIGGSGIYDALDLSNVREEDVTTPFGDPSAPVTIGEIADTGHELAFLPRHGENHQREEYRLHTDRHTGGDVEGVSLLTRLGDLSSRRVVKAREVLGELADDDTGDDTEHRQHEKNHQTRGILARDLLVLEEIHGHGDSTVRIRGTVTRRRLARLASSIAATTRRAASKLRSMRATRNSITFWSMRTPRSANSLTRMAASSTSSGSDTATAGAARSRDARSGSVSGQRAGGAEGHRLSREEALALGILTAR